MLNHFYHKEFRDHILITNDLGHYLFLSKEEFSQLLREAASLPEPILTELRQKYFYYDTEPEFFAQEVGLELRRYKQYLFQPTSLHIFVVTKRCNQSCVYCQACAENRTDTDMDMRTAEAAVDLALSVPAKHLTFEFQGGEPLLNWRTIRHILEYTEHRRADKVISYSLVTNLAYLSEEIVAAIRDYDIHVSTSLDGDQMLHDRNRPTAAGAGGAYAKTVAGMKRLNHAGVPYSALQTTTRQTLDRGRELVDAYLDAGLDSLFLRPLTPLGYAKEHWNDIGYTPEEFLHFYRDCLDLILEKNRSGIYLSEGHARIFLSKILHQESMNYMELRSPCGGGIGQMAYYYNGDIYTCDEGRMLAEMGDERFKMGNVFRSDYNALIDSPACKAVCTASCLESHPLCESCGYNPYCGVCPVVNLATCGDLFPQMKNDYRCRIYQGIQDILFQHLYEGNARDLEILESWTH